MEAIRWVLKNYPDRARGLWAEYIYPEDAEGIRQWATQQVRRLTR